MNEIIAKYVNKVVEIRSHDIGSIMLNVGNWGSWQEVCEFVQDDGCSDFFFILQKFCEKEGQQPRKNKGFIDGKGFGYAKKWNKRGDELIEKCFDAKYFYKVERPTKYLFDLTGVDLRTVAKYDHPGHWSYPAGHGTKFLTAVEVLNDLFVLDSRCYRMMLIAACVAAMGRSGNLIHYPADNLAGGSLTNLKEFQL